MSEISPVANESARPSRDAVDMMRTRFIQGGHVPEGVRKTQGIGLDPGQTWAVASKVHKATNGGMTTIGEYGHVSPRAAFNILNSVRVESGQEPLAEHSEPQHVIVGVGPDGIDAHQHVVAGGDLREARLDPVAAFTVPPIEHQPPQRQ